MFAQNQNIIPSQGYILKKWNQIGYRATALAYLKREKKYTIEHVNGRWYTLKEIKNAIIG